MAHKCDIFMVSVRLSRIGIDPLRRNLLKGVPNDFVYGNRVQKKLTGSE